MKKKAGTLSAKTQPLFDKVGQLTMLQRVLIVVVVFALLIGGVFFLSIKPRYEKMGVVKDKISKTEKELAIAKDKAKVLDKLKTEWEQKQEEFRLVMAALPDKQEIPSLLGDISAAGRNVGLIFSRFTPQSENPKEFYVEIPVAILISGTYDRLKIFFSKVAEMSRLVNIKNVNMGIDKSGQLTVQCTAVTYRFMSADEQKAREQAQQKATRKGKKK